MPLAALPTFHLRASVAAIGEGEVRVKPGAERRIRPMQPSLGATKVKTSCVSTKPTAALSVDNV